MFVLQIQLDPGLRHHEENISNFQLYILIIYFSAYKVPPLLLLVIFFSFIKYILTVYLIQFIIIQFPCY